MRWRKPGHLKRRNTWADTRVMSYMLCTSEEASPCPLSSTVTPPEEELLKELSRAESLQKLAESLWGEERCEG